jgi:Mn-dependent DtxR family transcriptional regulator
MTDERSPWLEGAIAINEALKLEPPEVQESIRRMDRKTYPETWKAIREREQGAGSTESEDDE